MSMVPRRAPRALTALGTVALVALGALPVRAERAALPASLVALDSPEGQRMLLEANAREDFFHLVATYATQEQPSFCGVASSVMILNALPIASPAAEPLASFNQTNFFNDAGNRVRPREAVLRGGMTLETLADLLRTHPTEVKAVHAGDTTLEAFRDLAAKNLAKAMSTLDLDSGKSRGFVVVSPSAAAAPPGPPKPAQSRIFQILAGLLGLSFVVGGGVGFGIGTWRARRKAKAAG